MTDGYALAALGWDDHFESEGADHWARGLVPARVAVEHRGSYMLYSEAGEANATIAGRLRYSAVPGELPVVGDWVAATAFEETRGTTIHAVLPRKTKFSRKVAWTETREQVVAANIDDLWVVAGLDGDLNGRRIERYLTMAWEGGARPLLVLTKPDLCGDLAESVGMAEAAAIGVDVIVVNGLSGAGVDLLANHLGHGRTVALVGSSGVGKSTILNRLVGQDRMKTNAVRWDGRGRHTTTRRELVPLAAGGLLLDTPGMRELQLWEAGEGIDAAFADVAALAGSCRFRDCSHEREPGCAVLDAINRGLLDEARLRSYRKLQRELRALELRRDRGAAAAETRRRRRAARARRSSPTPKL